MMRVLFFISRSGTFATDQLVLLVDVAILGGVSKPSCYCLEMRRSASGSCFSQVEASGELNGYRPYKRAKHTGSHKGRKEGPERQGD